VLLTRRRQCARWSPRHSRRRQRHGPNCDDGDRARPGWPLWSLASYWRSAGYFRSTPMSRHSQRSTECLKRAKSWSRH